MARLVAAGMCEIPRHFPTLRLLPMLRHAYYATMHRTGLAKKC